MGFPIPRRRRDRNDPTHTPRVPSLSITGHCLYSPDSPDHPPLEMSLPQQLQPITGKPAEGTDAHTCLDTFELTQEAEISPLQLPSLPYTGSQSKKSKEGWAV